ncbi:MAG: glycosyl transferase, family 11 [Mucilaginibacter sp.]|nr:glycosyl transferase, family 11 [Mucilaginibacter sp.]
MIIAELQGGLGNQMFQYAMGKSLSIKNNVPLKLALTFFDDSPARSFKLDAFNIGENKASQTEIDKYRGRPATFLQKVRNKLKKLPGNIVIEKDMLYHPEYKAITPPVYLSGYWQSEYYFKEHEQDIRSIFRAKDEFINGSRELIAKIKPVHAVSLHIRRGDYIHNKEINKTHGACSMEYYYKAIQIIGDRVKNPVFYIFSDDLAWCKQHIEISYPHYFVEHQTEHSEVADLYLMSICKHHIIANSSFSWWGAWLNPSVDKIVVAPQRWFADAEKNKQAETIVPAQWIRI